MKQKEENKEYAAFESALGKILRVSHSELKVKLEENKKKKKEKKGQS